MTGDLQLSVFKSKSPQKGAISISQLPKTLPLEISNLSSSTASQPVLSTITEGKQVYNDSPDVVSQLPPSLHLGGLSSVILPNSARHTAHSLAFHLSQPSKVFLMAGIGACEIDGGGWELVRYAPAGKYWYEAKDTLDGSAVYGQPPQSATPESAFSVRFDNRDFDELLVTTGDAAAWAVLRRNQLTRGGALAVARSSCNGQVTVSHAGGLSIECIGTAKGNQTLYAERNATAQEPISQGAKVYIRRSPRLPVIPTIPSLLSSLDLTAAGAAANWTLHGESTLAHQRLVLKGGTAVSKPTTVVVKEKTLEAWVMSEDVDQSGAVIAIAGRDGVLYDSITMKDRTWIASSNNGDRSNPESLSSKETQPNVVHLVVTYAADGTVTMYRDGVLYRAPFKTAGGLVAFGKGATLAVGGVGTHFRGIVYRAAFYSQALTAEQVIENL